VTFTLIDGVERPATTPSAACAVAVIYRKLSLGSQSDRGEQTIERLLSASITRPLQRRSLFAYLSELLSANIRGDPIPHLT
jgi:transposase